MSLLTRRQLLIAMTAVLSSQSMNLAAVENILPRDLLKNINIDKKVLALYAENYISSHPQENTYETLKKLIFTTYKSPNILKIKKYLNLKIENDFIKKDIVSIDGWILSRTEIRLWCLLHVMLR
jgi:hypothetical protein